MPVVGDSGDTAGVIDDVTVLFSTGRRARVSGRCGYAPVVASGGLAGVLDAGVLEWMSCGGIW